MPSSAASRFRTVRLVLGIFVLNMLLAFPVFYQTYKHYSTRQSPMDTDVYMSMAERGPEAAHPPFRHRIATPLLVTAVAPLPGYDIDVDFTADKARKKTYFHFLAVNFAMTVLTSALLFLWLSSRVRPHFAWAGSVFYLLAFYTLTSGYLPMTDAACHLAIIAVLLCVDRGRVAAFALAGLIGALAKETALLVLGLWIAVQAVGDWKRLRWLAGLVPGLVAYLVLARVVHPAETAYAFYDPFHVLAGASRVFDPGTYTRSFLFHALLGHMPLLAACAAWLWLRGKGIRVPMDRGLWVFVGLLALGIAMGIGNNAARLAFMAFPAVALFQARVMEGLTAAEKARG